MKINEQLCMYEAMSPNTRHRHSTTYDRLYIGETEGPTLDLFRAKLKVIIILLLSIYTANALYIAFCVCI